MLNNRKHLIGYFFRCINSTQKYVIDVHEKEKTYSIQEDWCYFNGLYFFLYGNHLFHYFVINGGNSMKSTRVLRKVDNWGKIVVPSVFRDELNIKAKDLLEIFVDGDKIIFRKFVSSNVCMITGKVSENNIILANGKIILNQEILKDLIQEIEEEI